MLYNQPSPLETRVLTRRFGLSNSDSIDTYLATDGYKAFLKAAGMKPDQIIEDPPARRRPRPRHPLLRQRP